MTETTEGPRTCYRHGDRETAISCTRCERPICPDCMRPAAVGFQCPECVREGHRTVREKRTVFGGRAGAEDGPLTKVLIGICVAIYLFQLADAEITRSFAMLGYFRVGPEAAGVALPGLGVADGEYYRMITSAFLHASPMHIAFNMYALYAFGPTIERQLGSLRFAGVYLLSALGGSVLTYLVSPDSLSVGASGAVFGLFGAYFVVARRLRADTSQIVVLVVINLVIGELIPNINNFAHIGGLVTGAALTYLLSHTARLRQRDAIQASAAGLVLVVLATLTVLKTQALRDEFPQLSRRLPASMAAATSVTDAPSR